MAQPSIFAGDGSGEVVEGPLAVAGHVGLADFPVETVVEESIGEVEEKVALHELLQAMDAHAVIAKTVGDGISDAVGVFGSWFDAWNLRAERLAAVACGAVFSDGQFDDDDFAESDVADKSSVGVLPVSELSTLGTWEGLWGSTLAENANTSGIHACVLRGLVW